MGPMSYKACQQQFTLTAAIDLIGHGPATDTCSCTLLVPNSQLLFLPCLLLCLWWCLHVHVLLSLHKPIDRRVDWSRLQRSEAATRRHGGTVSSRLSARAFAFAGLAVQQASRVLHQRLPLEIFTQARHMSVSLHRQPVRWRGTPRPASQSARCLL